MSRPLRPDPALPATACGCDASEVRGGLLTVDAALAACTDWAKAVHGTERAALAEAAGRHLAGPVAAAASVPPFDNAAVDGYAVRRAALPGAGPWTLPVGLRVAAGDAPAALPPASAARILTGAPVPAGADAVIAQEDVRAGGGMVGASRRPAEGVNIRHAGEDMRAGDIVLRGGRRLSRRDIALAAAAGADMLEVRRKVRIALLITGSELRKAGAAGGAGTINDVNGPMLAALAARPDTALVAHETGADDPAALAAALARLAGKADLVVTTGGVSVGDEDHLHRAIAAAGGETRFSGVAIKPGKPISFGRIGPAGGALWLGLPGNPLAAFVGWHLFGRALLCALQGGTPRPDTRLVVTIADLRHKPGRCEMRPARLAGHDGQGRALVAMDGAVNSARVRPLAGADGLVLIPAQADKVRAGDLLEFHPFDDF